MDLVKEQIGRQGQIKTNDNQIFIKDNWICSIYEVVVEEPEVDLLEKIKKGQEVRTRMQLEQQKR